MDLHRSYAEIDSLIRDINENSKVFNAASKDEWLYKRLVALFYVKGFRTLKSVYLLCSQKLGEDAGTLARTLFEAAVNVLFVKKDSGPRSRLFWEYAHIEKKRLWDKVQKKPNEPWNKNLITIIDPSVVNDVISKYNSVEANYNDELKWSGKSIKGMAQEVGLEWDYDYVYSDLSTLAHPNPLGIGRQIAITCEAINFGQDSSEDEIAHVWLIVWGNFLKIADIYNEVFGLGFFDRIQGLLNKVSLPDDPLPNAH